MSHYAQIVNGTVVQVIVAEQDVIDSMPGTWVKTSYNTRGGIHYAPNNDSPDGGVAFRANYAGIGYTYDAVNDVFYSPQPYLSWTISAPFWTWQPPTPYPTDEQNYMWNETTISWVLHPVMSDALE